MALTGTAPSVVSLDSEDPVDNESNRVQAVVVHRPASDLLNSGRPDTLPEEFCGSSHPFSDFHSWDEEAQRFERIGDADRTRS